MFFMFVPLCLKLAVCIVFAILGYGDDDGDDVDNDDDDDDVDNDDDDDDGDDEDDVWKRIINSILRHIA